MQILPKFCRHDRGVKKLSPAGAMPLPFSGYGSRVGHLPILGPPPLPRDVIPVAFTSGCYNPIIFRRRDAKHPARQAGVFNSVRYDRYQRPVVKSSMKRLCEKYFIGGRNELLGQTSLIAI
jgi:hypothetical protein